MTEAKQLLFVYNANSSILDMSVDYLHKLFSPATYQCSLCLLTHSNFGRKNEWKKLLRQLPYSTVFMYKDDFTQQYPQLSATVFPTVFINNNQQLSLLLTAEEIRELHSLQAFADALQTKLAAL